MGWKCNKCGKLINFSVEETWHANGTEALDSEGDTIETTLYDIDIDFNCGCGYKNFYDNYELYAYLKEHAEWV
jgi:hypothetical protein